MTRCQWFALCTRPAAGTADHPILVAVPICSVCAERFQLTLNPWEDPNEHDYH